MGKTLKYNPPTTFKPYDVFVYDKFIWLGERATYQSIGLREIGVRYVAVAKRLDASEVPRPLLWLRCYRGRHLYIIVKEIDTANIKGIEEIIFHAWAGAKALGLSEKPKSVKVIIQAPPLSVTVDFDAGVIEKVVAGFGHVP